jgi:hypothetical protein
LRAGSYGFRDFLEQFAMRPLERKKFPVISSLEGRVATFPGDPLSVVFGKFLERRYESLEVAKFSG